jgi:hypothetical protein
MKKARIMISPQSGLGSPSLPLKQPRPQRQLYHGCAKQHDHEQRELQHGCVVPSLQLRLPAWGRHDQAGRELLLRRGSSPSVARVSGQGAASRRLRSGHRSRPEIVFATWQTVVCYSGPDVSQRLCYLT